MVGLSLGLVLLIGLNICIGSVNIPVRTLGAVLFEGERDSVEADILLGLRMPRAIAAAVLGGGLALAGYLLQTFFHNPIAGPFILGISSGAKLAVALAMVVFLGRIQTIGPMVLVIASFAGALVSMLFVLLLARLVDRMSILIIGGVMIGYICSAITDFVVTFAEDADIVNLHNWSRGSFSGIGWESVRILLVVIMFGLLCAVLLIKSIGAYQLGEAYAASVGVNVRLFRVLLVILSSVLSGCVTAFAGPVSFVGVAVPHLVKRVMGSSRPGRMTMACFLGGAVFCLFCDLLARVLFAPIELSISTVTAVFGAPVVIGILLAKEKRGGTA